MTQIRRVFARVVLVASAVALAGSSVASAQDARAAQQVKLRQSAYTVLGAQMGLMAAQARSRPAVRRSPSFGSSRPSSNA